MKNMRLIKIILFALPTIQFLMIGINNAINFGGVLGEVTYVLGMSGASAMPDMLWRATESPFFIYAGSLAIVTAELLMAALFSLAVYQMWNARAGDKASFNAAKRYGIWACTLGVILFYGGFLLGAGVWFFLWVTPAAGALETAFRYAVLLTLIMIFVSETQQD